MNVLSDLTTFGDIPFRTLQEIPGDMSEKVHVPA